MRSPCMSPSEVHAPTVPVAAHYVGFGLLIPQMPTEGSSFGLAMMHT